MKTDIFKKYPEIKLAYLFGSRVEGKAGPMSDYDFAVYFDEKTPSLKRSDIKINLITDLMGELKTNAIDVVDLNSATDPLLKYEAIRKQKILYEKKPYKIEVEPKILSQYFDYYSFLNKKSV